MLQVAQTQTPAAADRAPRTATELNSLRARRAELKAQLEEVTSWRGRLVQERHNAAATGNNVVVAELDARIRELGARSTRIERQMLSADDAIAQAVASGVGEAEVHTITVPPPPSPTVFTTVPEFHVGGGFTGRDMAVMLFGEAVLFALIGMVLWRRAFRSGARTAVPSGQRDVSQLQQSVDAIAVEVERISENQRFVTKLLNEKGERVGPES